MITCRRTKDLAFHCMAVIYRSQGKTEVQRNIECGFYLYSYFGDLFGKPDLDKGICQRACKVVEETKSQSTFILSFINMTCVCFQINKINLR